MVTYKQYKYCETCDLMCLMKNGNIIYSLTLDPPNLQYETADSLGDCNEANFKYSTVDTFNRILRTTYEL